MNIQRKSFQAAEFKVVDGAQGIAEMIVSVFGNVDFGKETVALGFFAESIATKRNSAGQLRVKGVWGHDWLTPVAKTLDAKELPPGDAALPPKLAHLGGLWVRGQFNLDTQRGHDAFSDLQFGAIDEFSIGYRVLEDSFNQETGVRTLLKGEWYEWSPVLVGMNQATELLGTKAAGGEKKALDGSFENIAEEVLAQALVVLASMLPTADGGTGGGGMMGSSSNKPYGWVVATFDTHAIISACAEGGPTTYWDVPYTVDHSGGATDGQVTIGTPTEVELTYTPVKAVAHGNPDSQERFAAQLERVLLEITAAKARAKDLLELRAKEGRTFSSANVSMIGDVADQTIALGSQATTLGTQLHELLDRAAAGKAEAVDAQALYARFLESERRHLEYEHARTERIFA